MSSLKRRIYSLRVMRVYRELRTTVLAGRHRDTPYGFKFAGNQVHLSAQWELEVRRTIATLLPRTAVFIDIGANQGFYSCLAAASGVSVAAIEPEPGNLRFLKENARINGFPSLEIYPIALGADVAVENIFGDGDLASLDREWSDTNPNFKEPVPINTLDNLFAHRWPGQQTLIKVDVEGAEERVLRGGGAMLNRQPKPFWLIECFAKHPRTKMPNSSFPRVMETMKGAGYSITDLGDSNYFFSSDDHGHSRLR